VGNLFNQLSYRKINNVDRKIERGTMGTMQSFSFNGYGYCV